jgi:4'-phosphopantetheinyl transferase
MTLHHLSLTVADLADSDLWLSAAERERLAGFKFRKRRNDWLLGRWTSKNAVCRYLGLREDLASLAGIEIRAAADGAPEAYIGGAPAPVSLSISHSKERSLCVVGAAGSAVGCDLEWIEKRADNFLDDYMVAEEIGLIAQAPAAVRPQVVTLIWCAKESALKSLREGLRRDTRSVVVSIPAAQDKREWNPITVRCIESSRIFHGWWRAREGFVQAMTSGTVTGKPFR